MQRTKILAIVPAYNEQKNIARTINDLKTLKDVDILVVNDCSTDRTRQKALGYKIDLLDLPVNLGIGGAVQSGFRYALENNYDIVFQFDGDGQHVANEVNKIIKPIQKDIADIVIGSRFLDKEGFQSSAIRRVGIKIFEVINSWLIGQIISDNTSGFRAYNREVIKYLAERYPTDFPEPEAVILLGKRNFRMMEVPVVMRKRVEGTSSISGLKAANYMIKVLLSIFMTHLRN